MRPGLDRRRLLPAVIAVSCAAATAGPALGAAPQRIAATDAEELTGPALAGERVAWAEGGVEGAWRVRSAVADQAAETLADLPAPEPGDSGTLWHWARLAASPQVIAVHDDAVSSDGGRYGGYRPLVNRLLVGRVGAPLAEFGATCGGTRFNSPGLSFAVGGPYAAAPITCDERGRRLAVRVMDVGGDGAFTDVRAPGAEQLRVAGELLAWTVAVDGGDSTRFVAYDLGTKERRTLLRTRAFVSGWDVSAEGALAVSLDGRRQRLRLVEPGGRARGLPAPRGRSDVALAGDRVLVARAVGRRGRSTALTLVSRDGGLTDVARFPPRRAGRSAERLLDFDADSGSVAWAARRDGVTRIWRKELTAAR
ncbi:MAG TPA: hypothetical protein VIL49_11275 [Capillimicrobium sp.]|jgi:hypothetical protein